ncbi:MAG: efflux RND transporter periplasmic adaptor subunit [Thermosynechococcaceae cyanobacterium MS004]|nr:efflux RND transporter periplasmic adaptor subunit [Thermosynechococcaceae cyanobacterium MS004]
MQTNPYQLPTLPPLRSKVGLGLLGAIALSGVGLFWIVRSTMAPSPPPAVVKIQPLVVKTEVVTTNAVAGTQTLTGTVEPLESVTVTSRVMGLIARLPVQEGDRVRAGQVVAVIDVKDIQAQRDQSIASIYQAQAGVTGAQATQTQAIASVAQSNAQRAQAEARQQEAQAQQQEAEADLANALLNQQRMAKLRQAGAVSQVQLDDANTRVALIQAQIQRAKAGVNQARRGIEQAQAIIDQSQAQIRQANASVTQAQAQVRQAQASQEQAIANLDYGTVTAPFDAVVTRRHTEVGAMAGMGQQLLTLESVDRLRLSVGVPESAIAQVQIGQRVRVRFDALQRTLTGRLSQIIPSADPISRNFRVKISLPAGPGVMPGMFGRLELNAAQRSTLQIPQSAIVERTGVKGIFQVQGDHAVFHPVTLGKPQGERVEVFAGVKQGSRIILNPPANLTEHTPLRLGPA